MSRHSSQFPKPRIPRQRWIIAVGLFVVVSIGSSLAGWMLLTNMNEVSNNPVNESTPVTKPVDTPTPTPTPTPVKHVAPLTGLPTSEEITTRPIGVMINNHAKANPQSGLIYADMVWEFIAEGGITRYLAIFQSTPSQEPIGPVRSVRPYYIKVADSYNAIVAHAGGSPAAIEMMQSRQNLNEIGLGGPAFYREDFRRPPHNLYTNLRKLRERASKLKYDLKVTVPHYTFDDQAPYTAQVKSYGLYVDVQFTTYNYHAQYSYDALSGTYGRLINGAPHLDLETKQQLSAANVVILGTTYMVQDSKGRFEVAFAKGGPMMLLQKGKALEGRWSRDDKGVIRIYQGDQELPFVPGQTHYLVIPGGDRAFSKHVKLN